MEFTEKQNKILSCYEPKDRIFESALRRNFRDKTPEVQDFLVNEGYAKRETAYRCPHCDFLIGNEENVKTQTLNSDTAVCYACGEEFFIREMGTEPLLIRTDKKWKGSKEYPEQPVLTGASKFSKQRAAIQSAEAKLDELIQNYENYSPEVLRDKAVDVLYHVAVLLEAGEVGKKFDHVMYLCTKLAKQGK